MTIMTDFKIFGRCLPCFFIPFGAEHVHKNYSFKLLLQFILLMVYNSLHATVFSSPLIESELYFG